MPLFHPKLLKNPGLDDEVRRLGTEGMVVDPSDAGVYVFATALSAFTAGTRVDCVVAIALRSLLSLFHGSRPSTALELERRALIGELPVVDRRELPKLTAASEWLLLGVGNAEDVPSLEREADWVVPKSSRASFADPCCKEAARALAERRTSEETGIPELPPT